MINSFGHYVHFGRSKGCFVSGISGMPKTLPEASMPETLPTLLLLLNLQIYIRLAKPPGGGANAQLPPLWLRH